MIACFFKANRRKILHFVRFHLNGVHLPCCFFVILIEVQSVGICFPNSIEGIFALCSHCIGRTVRILDCAACARCPTFESIACAHIAVYRKICACVGGNRHIIHCAACCAVPDKMQCVVVCFPNGIERIFAFRSHCIGRAVGIHNFAACARCPTFEGIACTHITVCREICARVGGNRHVFH